MDDPDKKVADATPDRDYDTLAEVPDDADLAARPKVPSTLPPRSACDCDIALPPEGADSGAWAEGLRTRMATLELDRAVLVRRGGTFSLTPDVFSSLGGLQRATRLVLPLPPDLDEIPAERIKDAAVAGLFVRDPDAQLLASVGPRLADLGLNLEIECDDLAPLADAIAACPAEVVISGLGPVSGSPEDPAFRTRLGLVESGHATIKLSGLAAGGAAPWEAADPFVARLASTRPDRCLWGSGPGEGDPGQLLDAFFRAVTDPAARQAILVENPARVYGYAD